jgi:hypothetical protein
MKARMQKSNFGSGPQTNLAPGLSIFGELQYIRCFKKKKKGCRSEFVAWKASVKMKTAEGCFMDKMIVQHVEKCKEGKQ